MPPKSCSWAQVDIRWLNAKAVTFEDFEIMAPKIHMLDTHSSRGHISRGMVLGGATLRTP